MSQSPATLIARNTSSQEFIDFCNARHIDVVAIAKRYGKPLLPGPGVHFEDFNIMCDFYEALARDGRSEHFGIDWALAQNDDFKHAGPVMFLANRVRSWRSFIPIGLDYINKFTTGFRYSVTEKPQDGVYIIECVVHPLARPCKQLLEHHFATLAQMCYRAIPDMVFQEISFQHSGIAKSPVLDTAFRCPVQFNAEANRMTADLSILDIAPSKSAKVIRRGLNAYLDFQLRRVKKEHSNMTALVSSSIPGLLGGRQVNLKQIADALEINPKKLQRLLAEENTSFSEIFDTTRRMMAVRYLSETDMTLNHIAQLLDYANQETLIQAFHRWHGMTPSEFRASTQSKDAQNSGPHNNRSQG